MRKSVRMEYSRTPICMGFVSTASLIHGLKMLKILEEKKCRGEILQYFKKYYQKQPLDGARDHLVWSLAPSSVQFWQCMQKNPFLFSMLCILYGWQEMSVHYVYYKGYLILYCVVFTIISRYGGPAVQRNMWANKRRLNNWRNQEAY